METKRPSGQIATPARPRRCEAGTRPTARGRSGSESTVEYPEDTTGRSPDPDDTRYWVCTADGKCNRRWYSPGCYCTANDATRPATTPAPKFITEWERAADAVSRATAKQQAKLRAIAAEFNA